MSQQVRLINSLVHRTALPVLTGLSYFAAAFGSLELTRSGDGIAALWPASGIMLAVVLTTPRSRLKWHIAAAAIASLLANMLAGNTFQISAMFTVANISEAVIALWLLRYRTSCHVSFVEPSDLICFTKVAAIATLLSAAIATITGPTISADFFLSWFATDLLGILIVSPLLLIVGRGVFARRSKASWASALLAIKIFMAVAVVTGLCFWQSRYPLLFLPMLAVLMAVYRLGPLGAAGGVLIVAGFSSVATVFDHGPLALMDGGPFARGLFLQIYLLALFAGALPIATLLVARERLNSLLASKMRLLELAESAGQIGHWRLDMESQTISWSREVFHIHGLAGAVPPALDKAIDAYHPDDRPMVRAHIEQTLQHHTSFEFKARIVPPNGEVRHVFSKGEMDQGESNGAYGLFGIIQDISAQVAHEESMEQARRSAEDAAQRALIMAQTDQLTGIANRRRTEFVLDQAIGAAEQSGKSVSIAIFDIDHFKRINDSYGHHTGDEVIKRVAQDAAAQLRSGDLVGRYGGEEFVIVLPDATQETALRVGERIRETIEAANSGPPVTISIGVAELAQGETADALLRRADRALYSAKRAGRNRLHLAA